MKVLAVEVRDQLLFSWPAPFVSENRERGILANLLVGDLDHALRVYVPDSLCRLELASKHLHRGRNIVARKF